MNKNQLLTIKDVAQRLSLSPYTIKRMIREGELEQIVINNRTKRVSEQFLNKYIEQRTHKNNAQKTQSNQKIQRTGLPSLSKLRAV